MVAVLQNQAPCEHEALRLVRAVVPPELFVGSSRERSVLVLWRQTAAMPEPQPVAIQSLAELSALVANPWSAEHWLGLQASFHPGAPRFTADHSRFLPALVVDLDGERMAPDIAALGRNDPAELVAAISKQLAALGIANWLLVQSSPLGRHLYIPLHNARTQRPLGANAKTRRDFQRAAGALLRILTPFGSDRQALRITQPFILPGVPRLKHPGYIPRLVVAQEGTPTDLYALLRRLVPHSPKIRRLPVSYLPHQPALRDRILQDVALRAQGFGPGSRNTVAHDLAAYLLAKGISEEQAWAALQRWNERNAPPLPLSELRKCLDSACADRPRKPEVWAEMAAAPWNRLRRLVGLRPDRPRRAPTRTREPRAHLEERLTRYIRDHQTVRLSLTELANFLNTNRFSLRRALQSLADQRLIGLTTTRGRNGGTVATWLQPDTSPTRENVLTLNNTPMLPPGRRCSGRHPVRLLPCLGSGRSWRHPRARPPPLMVDGQLRPG